MKTDAIHTGVNGENMDRALSLADCPYPIGFPKKTACISDF